MLHRCAYSVALYTFDICSCNLAAYYRILRIVFEISSAKRVSVDVESRSKKDIGTIFQNFVTDGLAYRLDELLIPCRCEQGSDREVSAVVCLVVAFSGRIDTKAGRTVCKNDCRDAETCNRVGCSGCSRYDVLSHSDDRVISGIS